MTVATEPSKVIDWDRLLAIMTAFIAVKSAATLSFMCAILLSPAWAQDVSHNSSPNDIISTCGENQFRCQNGDCIQSELLCDGRADCSDQSDETQVECTKQELTCPSYAFRCTYGACVNGDARCNGVQDCLDNSDETLPECSIVSVAAAPVPSCGLDDYRCQNGQCISSTSRCDGVVDCSDGSDETIDKCGSFMCSPLVFRCNYGACIDGDLTCNNVSNCADGSDEDPELCSGLGTRPTPTPTPRPTARPTPTPRPTPRPTPGPTPARPTACVVPPQPTNGERKLHKSLCGSSVDCDITQGTELEPGSQLVYACSQGYKARGSTDVYCSRAGTWSSLPVCIAIKCSALNSPSTSTTCFKRSGGWISCDSPVPPGTRAEVSCRSGYRKDTNAITTQRETVECNSNGKWTPDPIKCIPGPLTIFVHIEGSIIRVKAKGTLNSTGVHVVDVTDDRVIVYTEQHSTGEVKPNVDVEIDVSNPDEQPAAKPEDPWAWHLLTSQDKTNELSSNCSNYDTIVRSLIDPVNYLNNASPSTPDCDAKNSSSHSVVLSVCGKAITHQTPFVVNGVPAQLGDFPWHATLYVETRTSKGLEKEFHCGATIIQTNIVMTAAHCIYDETYRTTMDPNKLFVMTGNIFRDYDSPLHNPVSVRKASVMNVYRPCQYYGLTGNYASDIALLELKEAFELSSILLPACLDVSGDSAQILEHGSWGRVAGFGRTATGSSSGLLQTVTIPYVPYNQCKNSTNAAENEVFIGTDKFCAGYNNGSAVCEGDSGGGLVFKKGDLWYVLGIVSVGLGVDTSTGERMCDKYSYSLYTKVANYMPWIQRIMFELQQYKSFPSCNSNTTSLSNRGDF